MTIDRFFVYFIDRLFMQQTHLDGGLPLIGRHVIERLDMETGEKLPPSVNQKILEGSYSTKLALRCDGYRVSVSGNPSRWQRMDNLFGLNRLDDCVNIYNRILAGFDLPPFSKATRAYYRQTEQDKSVTLVSDGAEITAIDWTKNFAVGQGNELPFIRGISSMQIGRGRKPQLWPNGRTCSWGYGSNWRADILYDKAFELREHLKKDKRKSGSVMSEQLHYIDKLIEYCDQQGVVREEHKLHQVLLKRYNLQFYGLVTEDDFYTHLNEIEDAMKTIQVNHNKHQSIAEQLLSSGAVDNMRQALTTEHYCLLWQTGVDLRTRVSRSYYYRHKSRLKKIGIDIGQVFDVTRLCPTLKRSQVIEVKPLAMPDWYQPPVIETTNILPFKATA